LAADTPFDIEARQIEGWRRLSDRQKAALVVSASRTADAMAMAGIRARFPGASAREQSLRLAVLKFGRELASQAFPEIARLDPK
jgi:hypothetical protein